LYVLGLAAFIGAMLIAMVGMMLPGLDLDQRRRM
jgi:hypothetical protein